MLPGIVTGIGSGFRGIGFKDKKLARHGLPPGPILRVSRVPEPQSCIPDHNIGGGFDSLDCREACSDCHKDKPHWSLPDRFTLSVALIWLHNWLLFRASVSAFPTLTFPIVPSVR